MVQLTDGFSHELTVSGEGSTVILLNGLLQTADSWSGFAQLLEPDYRVVRYDLRNQRRDAAIPSISKSPDCHVRDLKYVLDHLKVERATLVGQSFGSRIAIEFAATYPDRVDRLILLAVNAPSLAERYRMIFRSWLDALPTHDAEDWGPFAERVCPWAFGSRYLRERSGFAQTYASMIARSHRVEGVAANLSILLSANADDRAGQFSGIRCNTPALIINGADDYLTPPDALDKTTQMLPQGTLVVLPKCGHAVTAEAGLEFERRALDFLS